MSECFQPGTDPRRYLRIPLPVEVRSEGRLCPRGYAINLSGGGVCLQSPEHCQPGRRLDLRFRLDPGSPEVEVAGEVVWSTCDEDRGPGMTFCEVGIRFLELSEPHQQRLQAFLDSASRFREVDDLDAERSPGWSG